MSAQIYYEKDASLDLLEGKTIVFIGYGNQGRAQCLNLIDTLAKHIFKQVPKVLATSLNDKYAAMCKEDGVDFTSDFENAASRADVLFLLIPDQFQPALFNNRLAPVLKHRAVIVVASGYNYFYNKLKIAPSQDVVMVAPRMIGTSVRSLFVKGDGFPCFVSSEQDGSAQAHEWSLTIAKAIGALRKGAIKSSCREETLIDLFAEQALFPTVITIFEQAYTTLKNLGCSEEALCFELFMSKEPAEIFEKMADDGFVKQLVHHSTVSQYGQLKGALNYPQEILQPLLKEFSRVAENRVLNGSFAEDFTQLEEKEGGVQGALDELYRQAEKSDLAKGEARVRQRLTL
ncbi:IlvN-domain-containing protein [Exophiala viscosa]|uniref:IlvN-domain-containing protein n=1 Tax=Exophiala viscosa TaxID=2486360 RepID=UPI002195590D|nr:IlvN-domain-containing protein [Exophiala viscosa]